jgi:hypothetical protein
MRSIKEGDEENNMNDNCKYENNIISIPENNLDKIVLQIVVTIIVILTIILLKFIINEIIVYYNI